MTQDLEPDEPGQLSDELGRLIRDATDQPGNSYQHLADRAIDPATGFQMSRAHLHKLATGKALTPPGAHRLRAISAALCLPLSVVQRAAAAQFLDYRPGTAANTDPDVEVIVALLGRMQPVERRRWRAMMEAAAAIPNENQRRPRSSRSIDVPARF